MPQKETILITGSEGLLGQAITEHLQDQYNVIGLDIDEPSEPPEKSKFVQMDVTSDDSVRLAVEQCGKWSNNQIASVIHLAAYYDFGGEDSPLYDKITVQGTERFLSELKNLNVEQFVFSSTLLVHQPCEPGQTINEDSPVGPKWAYPESKVQTEQLLREKHGDIPIVILRIAGIYDDYCHSLPLSHQIQRISEKWTTSQVYPGNLDAGQALLHQDDLLEGVEKTIEKRKHLPREAVFLLGESETMSYGELQEELGELIHGREWETVKVPKALAKVGAWAQEHNPLSEDPFIKSWMVDLTDDHYALDTSRAEEQLGWIPQHSLRATLPKMIAALKNDPVSWYREHNLTMPSELEAAAARGDTFSE